MLTKSLCLVCLIFSFTEGLLAADLCRTTKNFRPDGVFCRQLSIDPNLLWSRPSANDVSFEGAEKYCSDLRAATKNPSVRVPDAKELKDLARSKPDGVFIDANLDNLFWSTTKAPKVGPMARVMVHPLSGEPTTPLTGEAGAICVADEAKPKDTAANNKPKPNLITVVGPGELIEALITVTAKHSEKRAKAVINGFAAYYPDNGQKIGSFQMIGPNQKADILLEIHGPLDDGQLVASVSIRSGDDARARLVSEDVLIMAIKNPENPDERAKRLLGRLDRAISNEVLQAGDITVDRRLVEVIVDMKLVKGNQTETPIYPKITIKLPE